MVLSKLPWQRDPYIDFLKQEGSLFLSFNISEVMGVQVGSSSASDGHPVFSFLLSCYFCHSLEGCSNLNSWSLLPSTCSWSSLRRRNKEGRGTSFFFGGDDRQKSHTAYASHTHLNGQNAGRLAIALSSKVLCIQLKQGILVPKGRRGVWMLGAYRSLSSPHRSLVLSQRPFSNSEHKFNLALKEDQKHLWIGKLSI